MKYVYAMCTSDGHFKHLQLIERQRVINDGEMNEDGVYKIRYINNARDPVTEYYIEKIGVA